jgi:adenosine/AMP kinase
MDITVDLDWVTTHDDLARLLRYAVPGARVAVLSLSAEAAADALDRSGRYVITLERVGHAPITATSTYALPALAEPIARHARQEAEDAVAVALGGRPAWEISDDAMAARRRGFVGELGLQTRVRG